MDISQIVGQTTAKRALTIALAGQHSIVLIGPPGCGKTSLLHSVKSIVLDLAAWARPAAIPVELDTLNPAKIQAYIESGDWLLAAMRPCGCGHFGSNAYCACTSDAIRTHLLLHYWPLRHVFAMTVYLAPVSWAQVASYTPDISTKELKTIVEQAWQRQAAWTTANGDLQFGSQRWRDRCALDTECTKLIQATFTLRKWSMSDYVHTVQVARTIADLAAAPAIDLIHMAEAIQYTSSSVHQ